MLARAREVDSAGRVEWVESAAETWDPTTHGAVDVLVTNATLQWVPTHLRLLPRWLEALAPGGVLAMQVPANFDAPVAPADARGRRPPPACRRPARGARPRRRRRPTGDVCRPPPRADARGGRVADDVPAGAHRRGRRTPPVLEWVRSTGLRPVLGVLTDRAEREAFLAAYESELEAAYPRRDGVVLFPFTRTFAVARMPR